MHRPGEERARLVEMHLLLEKKRIGAEIDEALLLDQAFDDLRQLLVQQRLAAGDGDDRRAAFLCRVERVLDRDALVQDLGRIVDLAAAGASEVAAKQRLE